MRYQRINKVAALFACVFAASDGYAGATHISLKKAMASKLITVSAVSTGGATGKSISLDMLNNTKGDLQVDIDPALIFTPEDTSYQNLVLLGNESVALAPAGHTQVSFQTFCGKSYARGPRAGLHYTFWRQGDSLMIKTLNYVKSHNIDIGLAQAAVWTFTNCHPLRSVYSPNKFRMSEEFVKYIAALERVKVPEYFIHYQTENRPDRPVRVAGREKIYSNIHWDTDEGYRHMYVTIYKANGEVYKEVTADHVIDKYGTTVVVEFDPRKDMKGTYYVRLHDDANKVWDEKMVVVEDVFTCP